MLQLFTWSIEANLEFFWEAQRVNGGETITTSQCFELC